MFKNHSADCRSPLSVHGMEKSNHSIYPQARSDAYWKKHLTDEQYRVMRHAGTEPAFSSPLNNDHHEGIYHCSACDRALFSSEDKYNSNSGWPSFNRTLHQDSVRTNFDYSLRVARQEVLCGGCGSHLGHVFNDGPAPTGLRYCMNGVALTLNHTPKIPS